MDRKIVAIGVLLTGLLVAMPVLAQDHIWTSDRPDGHAPAGIKSDYLLPIGGLYLGFRYSSEKFRGTLVGTQDVTFQEVLDFFTVAPLTQDRWTGELDVRYGLTSFLTGEFTVPWVRNEMLQTTDTAFLFSSSEYIGDLKYRGLIEVLDLDAYRLSFSLGGSIPTGKIGKRGTTTVGTREILPFNMQGGSGTWDILAGGTFVAQNAVSSVGAQINSVIRVYDNNQGYRLGDEVEVSVWGAYNVTEWMSFSMRGVYTHAGEISGFDVRTDPLADPLANPFASGGERVVIPFGANLYLRDGWAAGHRLSIEFAFPVHEDLNGPQFSAEQGLIISWQTTF